MSSCSVVQCVNQLAVERGLNLQISSSTASWEELQKRIRSNVGPEIVAKNLQAEPTRNKIQGGCPI
jgi:hypothetical protein